MSGIIFNYFSTVLFETGFSFFGLFETGFPFSPSWPGAHYVDQAGLELTEICLRQGFSIKPGTWQHGQSG